MSHDQLLEEYIDSDESPCGQWHRDVPSGLGLIERQVSDWKRSPFDKRRYIRGKVNNSKEIDAVCVTTQPTHRDEPERNVEYFDEDIFDDEQVILVEAKTTANGVYSGIGQLKSYSTHFREYWDPINVEELLILLDAKLDDYFKMTRNELPVQIIDVPDVNLLI